MTDEPALRLLVSRRELVAASGVNRRSEKSELTILAYRPSRLVLRSCRRSQNDICLMDAGQFVTFKGAELPEPDRWTLKEAKTGEVEWAFDSARFGARVLPAFTPDGRIVAAAFGNDVVSCRESATGKEVFRYTSESPLRTLALSPDGRTLFAACESGVVELRSLVTGKRIALAISDVPRQNPSLQFAFSPDGTKLATTEWAIPGGATPVVIWDVQTGKSLGQYPGHRDRAAALLFTASGRSLLIAAGPTIRCWFLEAEPEPSAARWARRRGVGRGVRARWQVAGLGQ